MLDAIIIFHFFQIPPTPNVTIEILIFLLDRNRILLSKLDLKYYVQQTTPIFDQKESGIVMYKSQGKTRRIPMPPTLSVQLTRDVDSMLF